MTQVDLLNECAEKSTPPSNFCLIRSTKGRSQGKLFLAYVIEQDVIVNDKEDLLALSTNYHVNGLSKVNKDSSMVIQKEGLNKSSAKIHESFEIEASQGQCNHKKNGLYYLIDGKNYLFSRPKIKNIKHLKVLNFIEKQKLESYLRINELPYTLEEVIAFIRNEVCLKEAKRKAEGLLSLKGKVKSRRLLRQSFIHGKKRKKRERLRRGKLNKVEKLELKRKEELERQLNASLRKFLKKLEIAGFKAA